MTSWEVFWWGLGGSAAAEIVNVARYFYPPHTRLPSRYRRMAFHAVRVLLAVVAGVLVVAYGINNPLLAFHIGAVTPLIVQALVQ